MRVTIYVEGAAVVQESRLRRRFQEFFERAGFSGRMPKVVPMGRREDAYVAFRTAIEEDPEGAFFLLVDSERAVQPSDSPWQHLARGDDRWSRPRRALQDQCHLMVQCIESWFLADRDALKRYFGGGFKEASLPGEESDIERVPKDDVIPGLKRASRGSEKGTFEKSRDTHALLGRIDPVKIRAASPFADSFLSCLDRRTT